MYSSTITKHWNHQHHTYSCDLKEEIYIKENTILGGINNKLFFDKIAVDAIEKTNDQYSCNNDLHHILQDVEQESSSCSSTQSFVLVWKRLPKYYRESQKQELQCQNICRHHTLFSPLFRSSNLRYQFVSERLQFKINTVARLLQLSRKTEEIN